MSAAEYYWYGTKSAGPGHPPKWIGNLFINRPRAVGTSDDPHTTDVPLSRVNLPNIAQAKNEPDQLSGQRHYNLRDGKPKSSRRAQVGDWVM